jgi:hypothetical protein
VPALTRCAALAQALDGSLNVRYADGSLESGVERARMRLPGDEDKTPAPVAVKQEKVTGGKRPALVDLPTSGRSSARVKREPVVVVKKEKGVKGRGKGEPSKAPEKTQQAEKTTTQLKDLLRAKGLPISGNKAVLVQRLKDHREEGGNGEKSGQAAVEVVEEDMDETESEEEANDDDDDAVEADEDDDADEESDEEDDAEHVVEDICDKRIVAGRVEYRVKWEGITGRGSRTWEPEENLTGSQELINEFEGVGYRDSEEDGADEEEDEEAATDMMFDVDEDGAPPSIADLIAINAAKKAGTPLPSESSEAKKAREKAEKEENDRMMTMHRELQAALERRQLAQQQKKEAETKKANVEEARQAAEREAKYQAYVQTHGQHYARMMRDIDARNDVMQRMAKEREQAKCAPCAPCAQSPLPSSNPQPLLGPRPPSVLCSPSLGLAGAPWTAVLRVVTPPRCSP